MGSSPSDVAKLLQWQNTPKTAAKEFANIIILQFGGRNGIASGIFRICKHSRSLVILMSGGELLLQKRGKQPLHIQAIPPWTRRNTGILDGIPCLDGILRYHRSI